MQTPKFRAWHKGLKMMCQVAGIYDLHMDNPMVQTYGMDDRAILIDFPLSELSLMQWTGLLDTHDDIIYENDILRNIVGQECYIVKYIQEEARFTMYRVGFEIEVAYKFVQANMNMFEIVSSVFENPDLAENKSGKKDAS